MRIHYLIHAPFEKLGVIEEWANKKKCTLSKTHTYRGEKLPSTSEFDFLIVMGGPQSTTQVNKWPYLQDEMNLIKKAIDADKTILGICLGAQLIAGSLGAKTERSSQREIGVFPVELLPEASSDPIFSQFPEKFNVMHWHNDMPGIPKGARLLAKSAGCPRQAFSIGDKIYAFQFHLEMTPANIAEMVLHCEDELKPDVYVESKQKLLSHDLKDINEKLFVALEYLSSKIS
jgi:GMP synthase (glutamine-hydrolysing)